MLVKKRWPIFFAAGSVAAYILNHYKIGGLDQLRLEPRTASSSVNPPPPGFPEAGYAGFPSTARPAGDTLAGGGTGYSKVFDTLPPWQPQLSVGEKLAVMEDRISQKIAEVSRQSSSGGLGFPLEPPLALPTDFQRNRPAGLPPTINQPTASAPSRPTAGAMVGLGLTDNSSPRIRIATFNGHGLGATHMANPAVVETLIAVARQFDVIALQSIHSDRDDILPTLVERINQSGGQYDYVVGPRVGRGEPKQQFAYVFNTARVETDRYQLYTVDDPEDLLAYEPLVAWFRCRDVPSDQAFTFSIVNLRISQDDVEREQKFLPNLIHAVASDGRREDDIIVVGDFGGNAASIAGLDSQTIRWAVRDVPTDVSGQRALSNILFPNKATCEFTGRSGVFDFLRKFNLSLEQAMEVSGQMPVWAEFSATEGAEPGRIAPL